MAFSKKMTTRIFDFESGKYIAVLNERDSEELGILPLDRVEIFNPKIGKRVIAITDVSKKEVRQGVIGLFQELRKALNVKKQTVLEVKAALPTQGLKYVRKKIRGETLSENEFKEIVEDINSNHLSEIELAAFMAAVYIRGYNLEETVSMTKALIENGKTLQISKSPVVDKHSIGGINGRTTLIVVPIIASAGYYIPKTSSRAITSASGTADAMEVLAPVALSLKELKRVVEKTGGAISWGGSLDLAPVDDKIIKIEHPLSLDPEGQIIASVMAKKASVGAKFLVIDLPVGDYTKISSKQKADKMAEKFIEVGERLGIKVEVLITDGKEPSGKAFGPSLEAKSALEVLEGKCFDNLARKSCELAGALLELVGAVEKEKGFEEAKKYIESGKALKKMQEIIKAQGGNILSSKQVKTARIVKEVKAKESGEVYSLNIRKLKEIARAAGAPADKKAGVLLKVETREKVEKGNVLYEIHAENEAKAKYALELAESDKAVDIEKTVLKKFT